MYLWMTRESGSSSSRVEGCLDRSDNRQSRELAIIDCLICLCANRAAIEGMKWGSHHDWYCGTSSYLRDSRLHLSKGLQAAKERKTRKFHLTIKCRQHWSSGAERLKINLSYETTFWELDLSILFDCRFRLKVNSVKVSAVVGWYQHTVNFLPNNR